MKKILTLSLLYLLSINCYAYKWETVIDGWLEPTCWRLEIPNGWIVVTKYGSGVSSVFYPDENHEWRI